MEALVQIRSKKSCSMPGEVKDHAWEGRSTQRPHRGMFTSDHKDSFKRQSLAVGYCRCCETCQYQIGTNKTSLVTTFRVVGQQALCQKDSGVLLTELSCVLPTYQGTSVETLFFGRNVKVDSHKEAPTETNTILPVFSSIRHLVLLNYSFSSLCPALTLTSQHHSTTKKNNNLSTFLMQPSQCSQKSSYAPQYPDNALPHSPPPNSTNQHVSPPEPHPKSSFQTPYIARISSY
jgi:hypothetical protein